MSFVAYYASTENSRGFETGVEPRVGVWGGAWGRGPELEH